MTKIENRKAKIIEKYENYYKWLVIVHNAIVWTLLSHDYPFLSVSECINFVLLAREQVYLYGYGQWLWLIQSGLRIRWNPCQRSESKINNLNMVFCSITEIHQSKLRFAICDGPLLPIRLLRFSQGDSQWLFQQILAMRGRLPAALTDRIKYSIKKKLLSYVSSVCFRHA